MSAVALSMEFGPSAAADRLLTIGRVVGHLETLRADFVVVPDDDSPEVAGDTPPAVEAGAAAAQSR